MIWIICGKKGEFTMQNEMDILKMIEGMDENGLPKAISVYIETFKKMILKL